MKGSRVILFFLLLPSRFLACPYFLDRLKASRRLLDESEDNVFDTGSSDSDDDDDTTCGSAFCYGRIAPLDEVPPFNIDFSELVEIGLPNTNSSDFNYMEDSQARRNVLEGFQLNNLGPSGPAGYTYVGQLLSHDINLDETSILGVPVDPATLPNTNTPKMELETLYDFNGVQAQFNGNKFLISGPSDRDFPRDTETGRALIPDGRNDEHRIVSQLAVAFMTLHNTFVDLYNGNFNRAKEETVRTWQSVVLTDLLPNLLNDQVLVEVLNPDNRKLYTDNLAQDLIMPVEFSTAAFRLFHSRARGRYRMNDDTNGSDDNPRARLFDVGNDDEPTLTGGTTLPENLVVEWERFFFELEDDGTVPGGANSARIMDMLYSRPIMRLPIGADGTPEEVIEVICDPFDTGCGDTCSGEPCAIVDDILIRGDVTASLAILDLVRSQTHMVPGGIDFANYAKTALGVSDLDVLTIEDMQNGNVFGLPDNYPHNDVPLLLYLAHESIRDADGQFLGELGSRIIAEVLYGLVEQSQFSILDEGEFDYKSEITGNANISMEQVFEYIGWM